MASDLSKTVSIIFQGIDKTGNTITGIGRNLDQLSGSIGKVAQPFADLSGAVLKTEAALAALAMGGLAYAYTKSIEFEGAVIDLQKVLGDDAGSLESATQAAMDLSNQYGVSSTEVLQSTANFKQAGFDIQESMQLTKNALDLVIAGDVEAAEASNLLISALKGFDAPATDAARLIDVLNSVSNEYATNVEELATGMAKLAPIANQTGLSFEETAGLLTPVIEVFRSGDEAATALKTGLLKLVDGTKPVKDALASIGVSQTDLNGNMRSAKDILLDVSKAFGTLDENQKLVVTSQLVGMEQAARMVTVFDNLGKSTEITNVALKATGSAAEEVALRLESGQVAVDRFGEGFKNLAIAVGDNFRNATTGAINGATEIENTLQKLASSGAFNELFGVFENMSTELGELFSGIADSLPDAMENIDWSKFSGSIEKLSSTIGDLFGAFFDDADLTTAEGLASAIQKIVDAGTLLTNVSAGIISVFEPVIELLGKMTDLFTSAGDESEVFAGQIMGIGAVLSGATGLTALIAAAVKGVGGLVKSLGLIKGMGGGLMVPLTISIVGGKVLSDLIYNLIPGLEELDKKTFKATIDMGGSLYDFLIGDAIDAVGDAGEAVGRVLGDGIMKAFGQEPIIVTPEADLKKIQSDWDSITNEIENSNIRMPPVATDFDSIQRDWDSIVDEIENSDIRMPTPELEFDSADLERDIEELRDGLGDLDLPVDIDDKDLDNAKKKIKKSFTKAEMGPVGIDLDFGGNGTGPADQFRSSLENMEPVDMGEVIDLSGLADMFEALKSIDDPIAKKRATEEALKIQTAQRKLMEEEARNLRVRANLAAEEARTAQIMWQTGGMEKEIKISASGLEPHMEAFMYALLKKIQLRANQEGAEFLLAAAS